ncbi:MAG: prepilin peptidase [Candidatus Hydrogenedentes bacterium]|nr:prepilin peptidase [Candidatus Hydrogenedentota bacterium]
MNYQIIDTIGSVFAFILGGMVGSFLNVCVYRVPRGESVVRPRSHCPKCDNPIAWYDNIPMVSWLMLGARCRHCGQAISWQYPLVEAITAVLFFIVYWRFGLVIATPIYLLLTAALVLATFVDFSTWTIPDEVTLPGVPIGIACAVLATWHAASGLRVLGPLPPVFDALIGVEVGGGALFIVDKLTRVLVKKRGMGLGDVKLLAMLGGFFGWPGVILIIVIASGIGSIVGVVTMLILRLKKAGEPEDTRHGKEEKVTFGGFYGMPGTVLISMIAEAVSLIIQKFKGPGAQEIPEEDDSDEITIEGHYLPFGPYLCLAGFIVMLFGQELYDAYLAFATAGV